MAATITYDREKFEELLLHIAERSVGDPNFGKTKLNKILFYVDFFAYGMIGKPVTGATYQRRPYGPVPKEITQARNALMARGDVDVVSVPRFGYQQDRLIPTRSANLELFAAAEIELIDNVINMMRDMNAVGASAFSHRERSWQIAWDGETIPYAAVFLSNRPLSAEDIRRGQEVQRMIDSDAA